ncbi:MAG TPA: response regulator transcription factor [Denitromonas sp.]|uniref:response regulator transcription factor n=1 Tax=Denitromonas sp. TaxID=2734609 RepID=UPI001D82A1CD|nr:response regulator transcription factor [Rhodocyclaceae bacterium]MCP5222642.1 response regulator transcription factor [Zoogloeaceae bacterium]HQU88691.1 response regulator transcription factor [Denitromonas sp.]HQV14937.1 response regulator transcription factor [Denitromonas sp.]
MTRVLLVDDDLELSAMLKEYLAQEGFEATTVADGEAGVTEALSGNYDIAVLDVMMPRLNGVDALRRIRQESRMPVLMLTARGDDVDRIVGLELGADDYVPKPCSPRELVARVRAILRRTTSPESASDVDELTVGPLRLWPARREAHWAGEPLTLTSTEFTLLEVLVGAAGHVVSKNTLSEKALGRPLARFDRSVDVHVSSLRHKLAPRDDGRSWIQTVRGQGYQFVRE